MKKAGLGWWATALWVGCSAPPLPTAAIEPGPAPGVERVTLRLPPAAASSAPPVTLLCDPRGPAGRRCEVVDPPPPPPAPAPPRSS